MALAVSAPIGSVLPSSPSWLPARGRPVPGQLALVRKVGPRQVTGGVIEMLADEVGVPGVACGLFDGVQDRPSKRHDVAKPGGARAVEIDLADRLVRSGPRPRVAAEDAVSCVTGLEL